MLLSLANREGLTLTLGHDNVQGVNRVTTVFDSFGRTIALSYDAQHRVASLSRSDGYRVNFAYDAANNLQSITWPDGMVRTYLYENASFPNNLTGMIDENGSRYATWAYDSQGRAISSQHAGGADLTTLVYNPGSTTVTDALGSSRTFTLQTILGVPHNGGVSQPGGSGCGPAASAITYDANGNVATRTDFNGNVTSYTFDPVRNLEIQRIEAFGKPEARTTTTQWHATFRLPLAIAQPLKITRYTYDATGNMLTHSEQATTDAHGSQGLSATATGTARIWAYSYDNTGQVIAVDGPRTDVQDFTNFTYNNNTGYLYNFRGNLSFVNNALHQITRINNYNFEGQPLSIGDPNGVITTLAYDLRGRLTSRSVAGETTTYQYDGVGQLTKVTLPDASNLNYTYDAAHRLTDVTDNLGNTVHYTLDAMGNRTQDNIKDPTNQLAQTRSHVFDPLNRLYQDVGAQAQTTSYTYDANGNLTGISDPLSHVTTNGYDALNRLVQITDPNGGHTQLAWNGQDRSTQVTDPRNLVTTYTVDGLGNLTQQASPDTGTAQSTYDPAGNLLTRTDAKGQTTTTAYDALNRPTLITYQDGTQQQYLYDQGTNGIGRLSEIDELTGGSVTDWTQYAYDAQGRVISETRDYLTTTYQYSNGRLVAMTYPSGKRLDYSLDALGRISQVTLTYPNGGPVKIIASNVQYQPFGGVKSWTNGAGQTYTRRIDQDGRIAAYNLGSQTWQIGYDPASRISYQTDAANAANTVSYGYDALDRLIGAALPNTSLSYGYDANGNRTSRIFGASAQTYQISGSSNQLIGINSAPPRSYAFDPNGSITGDGTNTFGYDTRGRLVRAQTLSGTIQYSVNALGQRVRKSGAGTDTAYAYDFAGHLIAEYRSSNVLREYFYLYDLPLAVMQ